MGRRIRAKCLMLSFEMFFAVPEYGRLPGNGRCHVGYALPTRTHGAMPQEANSCPPIPLTSMTLRTCSFKSATTRSPPSSDNSYASSTQPPPGPTACRNLLPPFRPRRVSHCDTRDFQETGAICPCGNVPVPPISARGRQRALLIGWRDKL